MMTIPTARDCSRFNTNCSHCSRLPSLYIPSNKQAVLRALPPSYSPPSTTPPASEGVWGRERDQTWEPFRSIPAAGLNRPFAEQGLTGAPGRIAAAAAGDGKAFGAGKAAGGAK
jgi:hypothetical protein